MTLMSDGLSALHTMMDTHASVSVTYTQSGIEYSISAVPGALTYEQTSGNVSRDVTRRSWFALTSELSITPARGDTIEYAASDRTETYTVQGDDIEPHWEYTDSTHEMIEIRTILTTAV